MLQQVFDTAGQLQTGDKAAHQRVIVALPDQVCWQAGWFELGNQYLIVAMDQHVQQGTDGGALAQAHVANVEGEDFVFGKPCEVRVQVKALVNQVGEVATDQFAGWQAQPVLDIFTGLQHAQVGGIQHQQKAVRLDAARNLNRFLGTALHGVCQ